MNIQIIKPPYLSKEGECWIHKSHHIDKKRKWGQCCCICKFLITDYWYCQRMPKHLKTKGHCGCEKVRGYICVAGEIFEGQGGSSGWPHHSLGCECFTPRKAQEKTHGKAIIDNAEIKGTKRTQATIPPKPGKGGGD